ncbi:protein of unknown function [Streptomyces sp. KY75]|nr:protein of unknown function [Streptomyces sp. KY75]
MLPRIDLSDLLFGVNVWVGLLDAFARLGDGTTRMQDLSTSVVACSSRSATSASPCGEPRLRDPDPGPALPKGR